MQTKKGEKDLKSQCRPYLYKNRILSTLDKITVLKSHGGILAQEKAEKNLFKIFFFIRTQSKRIQIPM